MSDGSRQQPGDLGSARRPHADPLASAVPTCGAGFIASIDAGLADADADDVMDTDELERWLAARRQVATPEVPR